MIDDRGDSLLSRLSRGMMHEGDGEMEGTRMNERTKNERSQNVNRLRIYVSQQQARGSFVHCRLKLFLL